MTNSNRTSSSDGDPGTGRLGLKLLGLFVLSTAAFFLFFFAYDVLTSFARNPAAETPQSDPAAAVVIDPKIGTELAKVLAADTTSDPVDIKDPFTDRAGLSGTVNAATVASASQPANAADSGSGGSSAPNSGRATIAQPVISPLEATKQRYESWLGRLAINGDTPLDPRIFSVEDLLPVGIVDGGSGQQEVMFYSEAAGKTVSFPLGTVFFDGWLTELRPEGVIFSSNDDRKTIRMRSWARSIKTTG